MSMSEWAKREVELAIEKEGEFDYGVGCYKSALKAFDSLMEDGHSGFSINATACILNRLIFGMPLTPIEDTDDIWSRSFTDSNGDKHCQCERMYSLFKCVHPNGTITYSDNNRIICYSIDNPEISYHSSLVSRVINEMFPITMPYYPNINPYKVYVEEFLFDERNGDFDTVGIFYAIDPNGNKVEINRYFKEGENHSFVEIDEDEYEKRHECLEEKV